MLEIKNLQVTSKDNKKILECINLSINDGEIHALVGKNGSGKSTLASTITGDPEYVIRDGDIFFNGVSIKDKTPYERAQLGIFYAFQNPVEVEGVTLIDFLWESYCAVNKNNENKLTSFKFRREAKKMAEEIGLGEGFLERYLNVGFSGGEKKKCEALQMLLLKPKLAILDETDSGLDVNSVSSISKILEKLQEETKMSILLITHSDRFADKFNVTKVHVIEKGNVVKVGGKELISSIKENGF